MATWVLTGGLSCDKVALSGDGLRGGNGPVFSTSIALDKRRGYGEGRRTDLPRAALVMEMGKTEGRSENEISRLTGIPAGTIRGILAKAHGWAEIAEGEAFKRHRVEQVETRTSQPHAYHPSIGNGQEQDRQRELLSS